MRARISLGAVSRPVSIGSSYADWDSETNNGVGQNRSTGGSWLRQTQTISIKQPILLNSVAWDIRNNGTYTLRFVTSLTGTTPLLTLATSQVLAGGATRTITLDNGPCALPGGTYYLQLVCSSNLGWWDYNGTNLSWSYIDNIGQMAYNTSTYPYTPPYRLYFKPIKVITVFPAL